MLPMRKTKIAWMVDVPLTALLVTTAAAGPDKSVHLVPIGTYAQGIFDQGAAEIVAHDPHRQQLFVVNAQAATVDVLDIQDPTEPIKIHTIAMSPFGGVANSIAVDDGVIAVAIEN